MKTKPLLVLATLAAALLAPMLGRADVVRPAPNFTWDGGKSVKGFKGQPVVLIIAPSPDSSAFRKQARRIESVYQEFAARKAIFIVAFADGESVLRKIPSNVPFIIANNGPAVAAAYGFNGKFSVNVIGKDGNLDLTSPKIVSASQIMDMIYNNYEQQASERKL